MIQEIEVENEEEDENIDSDKEEIIYENELWLKSQPLIKNIIFNINPDNKIQEKIPEIKQVKSPNSHVPLAAISDAYINKEAIKKRNER